MSTVWWSCPPLKKKDYGETKIDWFGKSIRKIAFFTKQIRAPPLFLFGTIICFHFRTELSSPESASQQNILHHLDDHNSTTVAKIAQLCENPIDDIRFAAFRLIVELAQQKWGLEV